MRSLARWLLSSKTPTIVPADTPKTGSGDGLSEDKEIERRFRDKFKITVTFDERRKGKQYSAAVSDGGFYDNTYYGETEEEVLSIVRKVIDRKLTDHMVTSKAKTLRGSDL